MPPQNRRRPIKALTIRQPFACAIAHLGQDVENRTWEPPRWLVGGFVAIHAAQTVEVEQQQVLQDAIRFRTHPELNLPEHFNLVDNCVRGAFVAIARLRGVAREDDFNTGIPESWSSPWFRGPFGWVWEDVLVLPKPIPCRGQRGVWDPPPEVVIELRREYRRLTDAA